MLAVLDASRHVRVDFDYPDLDVFFLAMENSAIITLNESNFDRELTQDDKPMIVDFWAEWCGPCKMIAPLLDEIARGKSGHAQNCESERRRQPESLGEVQRSRDSGAALFQERPTARSGRRD